MESENGLCATYSQKNMLMKSKVISSPGAALSQRRSPEVERSPPPSPRFAWYTQKMKHDTSHETMCLAVLNPSRWHQYYWGRSGTFHLRTEGILPSGTNMSVIFSGCHSNNSICKHLCPWVVLILSGSTSAISNKCCLAHLAFQSLGACNLVGGTWGCVTATLKCLWITAVRS